MNFFTADVAVVLDTKSVDSGLPRIKRQTEETTNHMQSRFDSISFSSLKAGIAALIGAGGLTAISYKCIKIANDAAIIRNKFAIVFQSLTRESEDWATKYADSIGRCDDDVRDFMSTFQNAFTNIGLGQKQALQLTEQFTQRALDVASILGKSDTDVVNAFRSALMGNGRALQEYGISIKATAIEQELWNMGVRKSFADVDAATKMQAAYNVVMRDTQKFENGATGTRQTYNSQTKEMHKNVEDIAKLIGNDLIPVATGALSTFNDWAKANKEFIASNISETLKSVADIFISIKDAVEATNGQLQKIIEVVPHLKSVFSEISGFIQNTSPILGILMLEQRLRYTKDIVAAKERELAIEQRLQNMPPRSIVNPNKDLDYVTEMNNRLDRLNRVNYPAAHPSMTADDFAKMRGQGTINLNNYDLPTEFRIIQ